MKRIASFFGVISTLFLCLSSCNKDNEIVVKIDEEAFENNKTKWEALEIRDYNFDCTIGWPDAYPDSYTIVVRNGSFHEITPEPGMDYLKYFSGRNMTIDNLFRAIDYIHNNPISETLEDWWCHEIIITYDATYFYPKNVKFLYKGELSWYSPGDEIFVTITRFEAE